MNSDERAKTYTEQTDDIYRAIGKFSVKFEQLVFFMCQGIRSILSQQGLRNQQLASIILADQTAYPIQSMFGSMIYEVTELNDTERLIVKEILKKVQVLIKKRNDIVHSTWFVGWASPSDTDFTEVSGQKLNKGTFGSKVKSLEFTSADFDQISDECDSVSTLIQRLWAVVILDKSIDANFYINDSGSVVCGSKSSQAS